MDRGWRIGEDWSGHLDVAIDRVRIQVAAREILGEVRTLNLLGCVSIVG